MILSSPDFESLRRFGADICVIGGGPVGITTSLALNDAGLRVLLLESGFDGETADMKALSEGRNLSPATQHRPETAVARRFGGTSNLWGGKCLPFDSVDYEARPWFGLEGWPLSSADLARWIGPACVALGAASSEERAVYAAPIEGAADADDTFTYTTLERWSNVSRTQALHRDTLSQRDGLMVALGCTVLGFQYADGRISDLDVHVEGRGRHLLPVAEVVLAAGGNESTRLLLSEQAKHPQLFGGTGGPLGRFYMGHVNGQIADIVFDDAALHEKMDFHVDAGKSYVRHRFVPSPATQRRLGISNMAFWPVVPPIADPSHLSAPLSALFLALTIGPIARRVLAEPILLKHVGLPPYRRWPHVVNLVRNLAGACRFLPWFVWHNRIARLRLPGFFLKNPARRYGLEYHSEHLPSPESRLVLAESSDRLGLRQLAYDLRFANADAHSVVTAHRELDAWLRRNHLGRLEYRAPEADQAAAVLEQAKHGAHQIGTIRMGTERASAVVDRDCRCFDVPNLYVISTAVLPTSGQASPTMTAVMLGLRFAAMKREAVAFRR